MEVKAVLRIAYSNQKASGISQNRYLLSQALLLNPSFVHLVHSTNAKRMLSQPECT
jgi:hypothetical protein